MKKIFVLVLLVVAVIPAFLFADEVKFDPVKDNPILGAVQIPNQPLTPRTQGMGGAGVALPGRSDAFFLNPAGFAKRGQVSIPSIGVTLYHPYDLLKEGKDGTSTLDKLLSAAKGESDDPEAMIGAAKEFLSSIKSGRGKIAEVNAGVSFNFGGFALGVNVNDTLHSYGVGVGGLDSKLFDELNVAASVGFGFRINFLENEKLFMDIGANFHPTYKAYTTSLGAQDILGLMGGGSDNTGNGSTEGGSPDSGSTDMAAPFMNDMPLAAGLSLPVDVGITLGNKYASFGLALRNINGNFQMKSFNGLNGFMKDYADSLLYKGDFVLSSPMSLDMGVGFKWDNAFFKPTLVCDFVDMIGFFQTDDINFRTFMTHFKAGAELRLLSILDVRGGLNQGYWTLGAGLDLAIFKVDIAYYWQEFGDTAGDNGLDAVSIRFNLGYDR